jgi:hypothetical protein
MNVDLGDTQCRRRGLAGGLAAAVALLAFAGAGSAAEVLPAATPGPWVEVTLKDGGKKLHGFLIECQGGRLRLRPEGGSADEVLASAKIESLNFAASPARQMEPPAKPEPPGPPPFPRKKEGDPKGPDDRLPPGERLRRWKEFMKKRAEERLTPEERQRFADLVERARKDPKGLPPDDAQELLRLQRKLGLLVDPLSVLVLPQQALREARQAHKDQRMPEYVRSHREALRQATTDEERRKNLVALCAAAFVKQAPPESWIRDAAEDLLARVPDSKVRTALVEEKVRELHAFWDLFEQDTERRGPRPPPQ